MPDLDILAAGISPKWARPYRLLAGMGSPADVAAASIQTLAATFRSNGGFAETAAIAAILDKVAGGQLAASAACDQLRIIESQSGGELHVMMESRSAKRLIVELANGRQPYANTELAVTEGACNELVANRLFDPARIQLVGHRFASTEEALLFEEETRALLAPQVAKLSAGLVHDQRADHLRAPRRPTGARRSTADMLFDPISKSERS